MARRSLGNSEIQVSPIAFGGNVFGWTADEATSFSLLDALADHGINFIDTADVYSAWVPGNQGGDSETIIGKWLKRSGKRDSVVIATKVGLLEARAGLSRENILKAADDSLRRLQTDYIDLYFSHRDLADTPPWRRRWAPIAAWWRRARCASSAPRTTAARGCARRPRSAVATACRLPGDSARVQPVRPRRVRERSRAGGEGAGLGVINYYALASGFLSGKYRSEADFGKSQRGSRVEKYLNPRGLRILEALDAVAGGIARRRPRRAGLADRAAEHHRADRQRHLARTTEGARRGDPPRTERRRRARARRGQRPGLSRPGRSSSAVAGRMRSHGAGAVSFPALQPPVSRVRPGTGTARRPPGHRASGKAREPVIRQLYRRRCARSCMRNHPVIRMFPRRASRITRGSVSPPRWRYVLGYFLPIAMNDLSNAG